MTKKTTDTTTEAAGDKEQGDVVDRLFELVVAALPEVAQHADDVKARLRAEFGGQRQYIASQLERHRSRRAAALRAAFNGRNISELARMFGVSRSTVRRAIESRRG